MTKHNKLSRW